MKRSPSRVARRRSSIRHLSHSSVKHPFCTILRPWMGPSELGEEEMQRTSPSKLSATGEKTKKTQRRMCVPDSLPPSLAGACRSSSDPSVGPAV